MEPETGNMLSELRRVSTYENWPEGNTSSPLTPARIGFVYSGHGCKIVCPLCRIELEYMTSENSLLEQHRKRSPQCALGRDPVTSRISSSDFIRSSKAPIDPETGQLIDVHNAALKRLTNQSYIIQSSLETFPVDRDNPNYELLRREKLRMDTFFDWPSGAHASPQALAREGFFYVGSRDKVRCAFCRGALHTWTPGDDPKDEHRRHFPNCPYVLGLDVANIKLEDEIHEQNVTQIHPSSSLNESFVQNSAASSNLMSAEMFMDTPTVRAVLEMGFSKENVKLTVQGHLEETGQFFLNAESLLEKLLSRGIDPSPVDPSTAEAVSQPENAASACSDPEPSARDERTVASSIQPTSHEYVQKGNSPQKEQKHHGKRGKKEKGSLNGGKNDSQASCNDQTHSFKSIGEFAASARDDRIYVSSEEEQLLEENNRLKEARTCKVCMDREVNTVFLPCGHLICCEVCSPKVTNCPLCRTFIRGTVRTFLS